MAMDPGEMTYQEPPHKHHHDTLAEKYQCEMQHNVMVPVPFVLLDGLHELAHMAVQEGVMERETDDPELRDTFKDMVDYACKMAYPIRKQIRDEANRRAELRQKQIEQNRN